jgi:hypothetical protein
MRKRKNRRDFSGGLKLAVRFESSDTPTSHYVKYHATIGHGRQLLAIVYLSSLYCSNEINMMNAFQFTHPLGLPVDVIPRMGYI